MIQLNSAIKRKLLYWRDLCRITRGNVDDHFKGQKHNKNVEGIGKLKECRKWIGNEYHLLRCDLCDVKVTA